jgi:hypothetical protein
VRSSSKNGEEEAHKINEIKESDDEPMRKKLKEKVSLLQDIPLAEADE